MKVLAFLAFAFLAGCSVHAGTGSGDDNCDCNVSLTQNNCTNDYHAGSKGELCGQLEDNNKDQCGMRYMREESFTGHSCDGKFDAHY